MKRRDLLKTYRVLESFNTALAMEGNGPHPQGQKEEAGVKKQRLSVSRFLPRLVFWLLLCAAAYVACFLKHPLLYGWRALETPALLAIAGLGMWRALEQHKRAGCRWQKLEPSLRCLACLAVLFLVAGQEGRFRWQQYQVLKGGVAMERMGRHFVVGFRSFDEVTPLAERGLIGGIYLTRRNLKGETVASLRARIDAIQARRHHAGLPPLFVMADQEGGAVSHLSPLLAPMPSLASLARMYSGSPETLESRARAHGETQGKSLAQLGVNMNLSPVVDLKHASSGSWRDRHSRIAERAIAADADTVIRVAAAYSEGLRANGVLPTVKHFPGLGRVRGDTHLVKASLRQDSAQRDEDWRPFRSVTARASAAMMLSHVLLPEIDPARPASLSRALVQDILRRKRGWNFQGILITDDLNMGAVYVDGIGRAATAALDAGVDLILVSYDPDQYYRALYVAAESWRSGAIGSQREAESATRLDTFWRQSTTGPNSTDGKPE
ncbi:MAG: hypothetical protein LBO79_05725 [Zoogloeaceae bacterium]|jgi:beta-N-acetylhexosaminidase|nr:hypothetical protein [Zoogloeaceae bacterium]